MEVSFHEGEFKSLKNDTRFFILFHDLSSGQWIISYAENQATSKKSTGLEGDFMYV